MAVSKFLDPKNDIAFKKIFCSEKNQEIKRIWDNKAAEARGKVEGECNKAADIDKNLLNSGFGSGINIELVAKSTGLTIK